MSDEAVISDHRVTGYISVTTHDLVNPEGRHVRRCARLLILSQAAPGTVHVRGADKTMQERKVNVLSYEVLILRSIISGETCLKPGRFDMCHTNVIMRHKQCIIID